MFALLSWPQPKPEVISSMLIILMLFGLYLFGRLPKIQSVIDLVNLLNSKGGNLALLAVLTMFFFITAMRYVYYLIAMMVSKSITADNAIAMNGYSFVTGVAFGGAFGALLKAMSGQDVTATSASKVETKVTQVETVTTPKPEAITPTPEPPPVVQS